MRIIIPLSAIVLLTCNPLVASEIEPILKSLKSAESLHVYEGLPHQLYEAALLKKERKREDTIGIGGFSFYTPKIEVADPKVLKDQLSSVNHYTPPSKVPKDCGGFHPDFAVTWNHAGNSETILICYGCSEARIISGGKSFHYNFASTAMKEVKKVLNEFRLKRPKQSITERFFRIPGQ